CPIQVLSAVTTPTDTPARPVTDREQTGLLHALSAVPDPRSRRGLRYPLAGLLTVAVCAVMAGASSIAAISDWLHDLDDIARARLGFLQGIPATTTMWRLLIRLDADLLATILAGWLQTRTRPATSRRPRYRRVITIDGKTLRGVRRPDGGQVHLLSALDTSTGIVLAQVTISAKSNEIPAFTPLLDAVEQVLGSLEDLLFVADALHTQTRHANEIASRGAHLLIPVKANQPTLFAQLKTLPWAQIPIGHQTRDRGHGRSETRTVKAVTVTTPGGIGFPHAEQAIRITRTRTITRSGKTSRETAYLTTSLPATDAHPNDVQEWIRREWLIENLVHHVRDVTFREDLHQARTGNGPAVMATLRNTAIGFHRLSGETNIARATRRANRRPHDLITAITSTNPRTQDPATADVGGPLLAESW
ncbi:ISAs1 family transposase, partial [Micromonospora luteifusca]|uniref:ISAs1 family transposase n=1 Tax=Micromonospora luteifusca TaxID=709860 RepID=UPI0033BD61CF